MKSFSKGSPDVKKSVKKWINKDVAKAIELVDIAEETANKLKAATVPVNTPHGDNRWSTNIAAIANNASPPEEKYKNNLQYTPKTEPELPPFSPKKPS